MMPPWADKTEVFGFVGDMAGSMKPGQDAQSQSCRSVPPSSSPAPIPTVPSHHHHTQNQGVVLALIASSLMLMPH